MLRFKEYINLISEGSNLTRPELVKLVGSGPNSGVPRHEVFANKIWNDEEHMLNDGSTIVILALTMGGNEYKASVSTDKQKFIDDFENTEGGGRTGAIKVSDPETLLSAFAKTPEYGGRGGGKKISESTQEIMTCAVVLLNTQFNEEEITVEDAATIIEDARDKFKKIKGVEGKESLLDQFTNNWYDLATAISSSNAILKEIKEAPTDAYWTGKSWHLDIAVYNSDLNGVKDYNSSDIVIATGEGETRKYYGFSLKKKKSNMDADPTLINKPITGTKSFLKDWIDAADLKKIEDSKKKFFTQMIIAWNLKDKPKKKFWGADKKGKILQQNWRKGYTIVRNLSDKDFDKEIRKITNDFANDMLRGVGPRRNVFWETVDTILKKYYKVFVDKFLRLTFRYDLQGFLDELKDAKPFKFYLLTGIGQPKGDSIGVEPAEVKDLPSTIEKLTTMFNTKDALSLGKTKRTIKGREVELKQPWEYKKSEKRPAKLFYTIYNGTDAILNIEVRYKGSKTVEPQFQATATQAFKDKIKE